MRIPLRSSGSILLALLPLPLIAVMPLREQWQAACRSLAGGDPANALATFRTFDQWYGSEPEVAKPEFNEIRIRLWGLAAMQAGALEEAARLLERWLVENPGTERFRAFIRFQLTGIHQALGNWEMTARHRSAFLEDHPNLPETALIRWVMADEAFAEKDFAAAREQLLLVRETRHLPSSGHLLAATALALVELAAGNAAAALDYLRPEAAGNAAVLLDFWRSLLAPSLARQLLKENDPQGATIASSWFEHRPALGTRLARFRQALGPPGHGKIRPGQSVRGSIWNAHWQGQLAKLSHSLGNDDESRNELEQLYRLRLRTLFQSARHGDSIVLGTALFQSAQSVSPALRTSACKAAIEGHMHLRQWDRAEAVAYSFLERFPEDPDLPEILLLQARSAAGRGQWGKAVTLADRLLASWPEHRSRHSWRLYRAGWLLDRGHPEAAREAFSDLSQSPVPETWKPFITFQTARCLEVLRLLGEATDHYRSVTSLSASASRLRESAWSGLLKIHLREGNDDAFEEDLSHYRSRFPDGSLQATMTNLEGSNHRRHGRHEAAVAAFSKVASGSSPVNGYAREQLSLLFREARETVPLKRHALAWISSRASLPGTLSPTPFEDCRLYQR
ncbi:MAG TPA: tetratricopeptide repeat protein, partial [Oceanipulchritudo sp.]|nr:tetratricopeptide repeat protein [Oceanipulchritudo sp.]